MTSEFIPGTTFGKYELLEKIGMGGMAEIYKARVAGPDGFQKILVVKKVLPAYARNQSFIKMLIAEAKLTSMLQHINVVPIYELGEIDENYYIAMEYVHGADLLKILTRCTRAGQRIPTELVMYIVSEIARGLGYAHTATDTAGRPLHIIHRDVSPSNVLVSFKGEVKVMDFGVARADLEATDPQQGGTGGVLKGKLGYMSPEQVTRQTIDHRSDLFALGIILFEALTLKRLFLGKSEMETLKNVREANLLRKMRKHKYIPADVQTILRKALSKERDDRFQSAAEFQEALDDWLYEHKARISSRVLSTYMHELFGDEARMPVWAGETKAALRLDDDTPTRRPPPEVLVQGRSAHEPARPRASAPRPAGEAAPGAQLDDVTRPEVSLEEATSPGVDVGEATTPGTPPPEHLGDAPRVARADATLTTAAAPAEPHAVAHGEPAAAPSAPSRPAAEGGLDDVIASVSAHDAGAQGDSPVPEELAGAAGQTYRLKQGDGVTFGPITFNNLMNLIRARSISGQELVSVDGGEWTPVRDLSVVRRVDPTLLEDELEQPLHEGPVSRLLTPQLLYRLSVSKVGGKLKLTRGTVLKEIYFQHGVPVHITSNIKTELLGAFVLREGHLSRAQLQSAVDVVREQGGRLGDALVRLGTLKPHDLFRVLEAQFQEKLLEIFSWDRGWYQFFEGHMPPSDIVWMSNDAVQLITAGVRDHHALPLLRRVFEPYLDRPLVLQNNPYITHSNLRFNSRELRFYTCLETGATLRQTLDRFGRDDDSRLTLLQVIFVLHQSDLLAFRQPQPARA